MYVWLMLLFQQKWQFCETYRVEMFQYVCMVNTVKFSIHSTVKNKQTSTICGCIFLQNGQKTYRGRTPMPQELAIVNLVRVNNAMNLVRVNNAMNLVRANNAIRLHQLQQQILADGQVFNNINRVSITTIRWILVKHNMTMKQLYRVPFERNGFRVKELQHEYTQVSVSVLYIYNKEWVQSSNR